MFPAVTRTKGDLLELAFIFKGLVDVCDEERGLKHDDEEDHVGKDVGIGGMGGTPGFEDRHHEEVRAQPGSLVRNYN